SNVPTAVIELQWPEPVRFDFRMAWDQETVTGAAFDTPGEYVLRIGHTCRLKDAPPQKLLMGDFKITVLPPEGDDRKALDILDEFHIFKAFQIRSSHLANAEPV